MKAPATPRTPWGWAASGVAAGVVASVLLWAPAHWLGDAVQNATGNRLQLRAAQGTLWSGSAQLVVGSGDTSTAPAALPGRVAWTLRPGGGSLRLSLQAPCCLAQDWDWTVSAGWDGLLVLAGDLGAAQAGRWPANLLASLGTPWNTLQLQGTLALSCSNLRANWDGRAWRTTGQAQLDALALATRISSLPTVGSYRLVWNGAGPNGAGATLALSTLEGSLQLQGRGEWVGAHLRFTGEARASAAQETALANLLNIMGRREGARSIITVG